MAVWTKKRLKLWYKFGQHSNSHPGPERAATLNLNQQIKGFTIAKQASKIRLHFLWKKNTYVD